MWSAICPPCQYGDGHVVGHTEQTRSVPNDAPGDSLGPWGGARRLVALSLSFSKSAMSHKRQWTAARNSTDGVQWVRRLCPSSRLVP